MRSKNITTTYKQYSLVQVDTCTVDDESTNCVPNKNFIQFFKPGCLGKFSPAQMILLLVQTIKFSIKVYSN